MLKILKNKDKSLIEFNLFDNPFYFFDRNEKCGHISTHIEDFKNGICIFCENLPLIKVGPPEKRIKMMEIPKIKFKSEIKIFSWEMSTEDDYYYELYEVQYNPEDIEIIEDYFRILCREYFFFGLESHNKPGFHNLIVKAIRKKPTGLIIDEQVVGFSLYEDNFNNNINEYTIEELNNFMIKQINKYEEHSSKNDMDIYNKIYIYLKLLNQSNLHEEYLVNNIYGWSINSFLQNITEKFANKTFPFYTMYYISKFMNKFKHDYIPEINVHLICSSERHKANIGTAIFYFLQNKIKQKINELKSIEGYIYVESIPKAYEFYKKLGFSDFENDIFYRRLIIDADVKKEEIQKASVINNICMLSPNLVKKSLNVQNIEKLIIN